MSPLVLKPVFKERIWGGRNLEKMGYDIPDGNIGECWGISAHQNGPNVIANGAYEGQTLDKVWEEHPELFGNPSEKKFPLLTKILDANQNYLYKFIQMMNMHTNMKMVSLVKLSAGMFLTQKKTQKLYMELMQIRKNSLKNIFRMKIGIIYSSALKLKRETFSMCQVVQCMQSEKVL